MLLTLLQLSWTKLKALKLGRGISQQVCSACFAVSGHCVKYRLKATLLSGGKVGFATQLISSEQALLSKGVFVTLRTAMNLNGPGFKNACHQSDCAVLVIRF